MQRGAVYNENSLTVAFGTRTMIYNTKAAGLNQHFATNIIKKSVVAVNVNAQASGTDGVATQVDLAVLLYEIHKGRCKTCDQ